MVRRQTLNLLLVGSIPATLANFWRLVMNDLANVFLGISFLVMGIFSVYAVNDFLSTKERKTKIVEFYQSRNLEIVSWNSVNFLISSNGRCIVEFEGKFIDLPNQRIILENVKD